MSDKPITMRDAATLARSIVDKTNRETPSDFIQFGTLVSYEAVGGTVPYANVHMDGDPPDHVTQVASLNPSQLAAGSRVAVIFDRPHGAYIFGVASANASTVPLVRAGTCVPGGGGGEG